MHSQEGVTKYKIEMNLLNPPQKNSHDKYI